MGERVVLRLCSFVRLKRTTALCSGLISIALLAGHPDTARSDQSTLLFPDSLVEFPSREGTRSPKFSFSDEIVSQNGTSAVDFRNLTRWSPHAEGTIGNVGRNGDVFGNIGLFLPAFQTNDTLVFVDLRADFGEQSVAQGSLGVGYRRLVPGGLFGTDAIVGLNAYIDVLNSERDLTYWQGSVGAELITNNFDFHANIYEAESNPFLLNQQVFAGPGLSGTRIVQQNGTITNLENAFSGFDVEAAFKVDLSDTARLRVHGGYSKFERGTTTYKGPRAGFEVGFENAFGIDGGQFSFGAEVQEDNLNGMDYAGFVRLRIPLGPNRKTSVSGGSASRSQNLDRQMVSRVRRQGRIFTELQTVDTVVETPILDAATGQALNAFFISETPQGIGNCSGTLTSCTFATVAADPEFGAGDILIPIDAAGAISPVLTFSANNQQVVGAGDNGTALINLSDAGNSILNLTGLGGRPSVAGVNVGANNDAMISGITTTGPAGITGNGFGGTLTIDDVQTDTGGVNLTGPNAATVNITNSTLNGGPNAALMATSTTSGGLLLNVSNTTLSTTGAGPAVNVAGNNSDDVVVTGFANNTVTGTGGVSFDNAIFDADGNPANGITQVGGGTLTIGSVGAAVTGNGLNLNEVLGDLAFTDLNITNDTGTGLFIRDDAGKGGTFSFGATTGTITTTNGTAVDIDPVILNVTLATLNANGGTNGVVLDTVTGTFNVLAGSITNTTGAAFSLNNSDINVSFGATIGNA